jgi:uncharacterized protein YkwD
MRIAKGPAKVIPLPAGGRRRRHRRKVGIGIASMGLAAAGAALVWLYLVPLIGLAPDLTAGMSAQEAEILRLVNDERKRAGAPALKSSQRLMLASRGHSYDMALRNYLSHDGPAGDTPAERVRGVGVDSAALGENIYLDRDTDRAKLAARAVKGWLDSPEHRANMLSPDFATTGVGIARAADGTTYVTQDFAK